MRRGIVVRIISITIAVALSACASAAMAQAPDWFYGHPAPTISSAAALKEWHDCITAAAVRLEDHKSSVMDIAVAIEPLCMAKEDTMIDAINKEFMDQNPGLAGKIGVTQMEQTRQESHTNSRQNIEAFILAVRKLKAERPH